MISCGDSHSAAITEKNRLFTWGNGTFGRLGHGIDTTEKKPKLVEDLDNYEIIQVSCGAFHTLAVTSNGLVFGFGQGKYGKMGINRKDKEGIFLLPTQLDLTDVVQCVAGINNSMALTQRGKIFTWGYGGKGLLGRKQSPYDHFYPREIMFYPFNERGVYLDLDKYKQ